jgi:formate-dependent nitrite reductase membrane component NrfD
VLLDRLNPVHWSWLVYVEMFVAGVAAGAYLVGVLLEWQGRGRASTARAAHLVAFPLIAVATVLLILDLDRPERFWHMVLMSKWGLPILKTWSPISYGSWLAMAFTAVALVSFVDALIGGGLFSLGGWRRGRTLHGGPLGFAWSLLGAALAVAVGAYSGVLLSATNIQGWGQTALIPAVYVATAMVTGVAAVVLVQAVRGHLDADVAALWRTNAWLLALWLAVAAAFLLALTDGSARFFLFGRPLAAIVLALGLGGIVPLVLGVARPERRAGVLSVSAALVLVGGFLLRYAIVAGPQEYLSR